MDSHRWWWTSGGGAAPPPSRIRPSGLWFVDAAGAIAIRRGITAFTLPKRYATGRSRDAGAYLDWIARMGLNEGRIFARVDWKAPPAGNSLEDGWEYDESACEASLDEAAARGLRLQVVANTGPHGSVSEMAEHTQQVDELCLRYENALLEIWNEPQQNAQNNELVDAVLDRYTPKTPGWSTGVYVETPYTPKGRAGQSMDYHSPRKAEWSRCFKDAYEYNTGGGPNVPFTPPYSGPVMQSEPPQVEQTIRDWGAAAAADDWRAFAAGSAFFACGATIHSNPTFQQCIVPTDPAVIACVEAFVAGFGDVPAQTYSGYSGAMSLPPGLDPGARRYQRNGADGKRYQITVRPYSFGPV